MSNELINKDENGNSQGRDLVNQLLGQAQMANAISKFSLTFGISKLIIVKETKGYKDLKGMHFGGSELKGTWEEFCNLLGISVDKADADISNLKAFGEEALEAMQRVGVGYRDLAQFRKLPEDTRTQLIEVAKSGDKEALLDLAETIIEKHTKDKALLTDQVQQLQTDRATEAVKYNRMASELELLDKKYKRIVNAPQVATDTNTPEVVCDMRLEVAALYQQAHLALSDIGVLMANVSEQPDEWRVSVARGIFSALSTLSNQARGVALALHTEFGAELDGDWTTQDKLSQGEIFKCAMNFDEIAGKHKFDKEKREYERDMAKPKGKGRPKAAPVKD